MPLPTTLISTIGTSLYFPNLRNLPDPEGYTTWLHRQPPVDHPHLTTERIHTLKNALAKKDWATLAQTLTQLPPNTRLCGAEINAITDLEQRGYCIPNANLKFCHSATPDGEQIATILQHYYHAQGRNAEIYPIEHLQDSDPKRFKSKGLRTLAKTLSQIIRDQGAPYCAINATGGYKAQIAIAVLMGQALGVPVYYKHERFSEIIEFPPMPVGLDFNLWLERSGLLTALDQNTVEASTIAADLDERVETLINRETLETARGPVEMVELSPTGQIFHETFKGRFASQRDLVLPASVPPGQKKRPHLTDHSWGNARSPILNLLEKITTQVTYVRQCRTYYWNPSLPEPFRFRRRGEQIEGIFSNGTWTVKFYVDTSANSEGQQAACIADLNTRLGEFV